MLLDLRVRGGSRDRVLFTSRAILPTLIILMTTMSCSRPDLPQPYVEIVEPELFSAPVTEAPRRKLVQGDEAQPKVRREQPKASASRKVATSRKAATEHAPNTTSPAASDRVAKKAKAPPRPDAQTPDAQTEEQLFQEFLEWRRRQTGMP